ncbi:hypothetical protein BGX23_011540 [Mortierella sp. AD031]|nr:hypothetical protein BGX23_011540 [Mortierella sp. AD031]
MYVTRVTCKVRFVIKDDRVPQCRTKDSRPNEDLSIPHPSSPTSTIILLMKIHIMTNSISKDDSAFMTLHGINNNTALSCSATTSRSHLMMMTMMTLKSFRPRPLTITGIGRPLATDQQLLHSHEVHSNNFITEEEFLMPADDYLLSLSPKKREKVLLSNAMYQKILMVLLQPKNTQVSTAQFRFWAKKMFTLSTTETHHIVCHNGKPIATKECLYDVLVYCHCKSSHGGRDKTSAESDVN